MDDHVKLDVGSFRAPPSPARAAHAVDIPQVKMDMKRDSSSSDNRKLMLWVVITSIATSAATIAVAVNVLGLSTGGAVTSEGLTASAATNLNTLSKTMQVSTAEDGVRVITVKGRLVILKDPALRGRRLSEGDGAA